MSHRCREQTALASREVGQTNENVTRAQDKLASVIACSLLKFCKTELHQEWLTTLMWNVLMCTAW